jgi:hypothetical protein
MSHAMVRIRELAAWGFDPNPYRPQSTERPKLSPQNAPFQQENPIFTPETEHLRERFASCAPRPDLLAEMSGLTWSLDVVDLRELIAFQRRLAFPPAIPQPKVPRADDWQALFAFCFPAPKPVEYALTQTPRALILESSNPDLHLRVTGDPASPLSVHAGGPFFEVACFRDRWFLRDGYHRAYALLSAGIVQVPAVVVHAATLAELGAIRPHFFPQEILFSQSPPRVADFLNPALVLEYERPPFRKTIRIAMEETLEPVTISGEPQ